MTKLEANFANCHLYAADKTVFLFPIDTKSLILSHDNVEHFQSFLDTTRLDRLYIFLLLLQNRVRNQKSRFVNSISERTFLQQMKNFQRNCMMSKGELEYTHVEQLFCSFCRFINKIDFNVQNNNKQVEGELE